MVKHKKESSIFIDLKNLRKMVFTAMKLMEKSNRPTYGRDLIEISSKMIYHFVLAFENKDIRFDNIEMLESYLSLFQVDFDMCVELNIIHFPKAKNPDEMEPMKVDFYKTLARIDEGLCSWKKYISKGTTVIGGK